MVQINGILGDYILIEQTPEDRSFAKRFDISKIDFDLLRKEFAKVKKKNLMMMDLEELIRVRLDGMLKENPRRVDYYERYQKIIEEYNSEQDRANIEKTFMELMDLANSLNQEEQRFVREGFSSDEELSLYDLLFDENLSKEDIKKIKKVAVDLLAKIKAKISELDHWTDKQETKAEVDTLIGKILWEELPESYSDSAIFTYRQKIYEYVYMRYKDRAVHLQKLQELYPSEKLNTLKNWESQIYPIAHRMQKGDWIVLPSKRTSTIHIGKVVGDYTYDVNNGNPYYHYRDIDWFAKDIPRNNFDQDLLYSFGAFMTVCKITRNDAEKRIRAMADNNWKVPGMSNTVFSEADDTHADSSTDLEEAIYDTIAKHIYHKFKGYKMETLIEEILKAKGFTVYHSKQGTDGGKDLLASGGEMGFGSPKICVQVKTQDTPVDRPTLDQLGGVMNNVQAEYGLLVSWNGFKDSVAREEGNQFFKIRLWDSTDVISELFNN